MQVVYNAADLKGKSTKGVRGAMEAEKALDLLLEGTDLKLRRDRSGAVIIFFRSGEQAGLSTAASPIHVGSASWAPSAASRR